MTGHLATTEKSFYKSYASIGFMHNTDIKMADLYCQYTDTAGSIDKAIKEVIANSDFIKGEAVGELESRLAGLLDTKHCITCGNGTDALFISMMATGIGQGDEVIVPAFSFGAVAEAVALLGGTPVFADVEADTFNMSADSAERMITPRTKAIVPVHLFGQPCDMAAINDMAARHGLTVIEDNAQSLGSECFFPDGTRKYSGTAGHIGCTSFFPSKPLGCFGDGGAMFTDDDRLAERMRALSNHGQIRKYNHLHVGVNSRLDTIQAAVLLAKLGHIGEWTAKRRKAAEYYTAGLAGLDGTIITPAAPPHGTHVYHQYTIRLTDGNSRDALKNKLAEAGIPSMIYYPMPLTEQPAYKNICLSDRGVTQAAKLSETVLSLPMHSGLKKEHQDTIIGVIRQFCRGGKNKASRINRRQGPRKHIRRPYIRTTRDTYIKLIIQTYYYNDRIFYPPDLNNRRRRHDRRRLQDMALLSYNGRHGARRIVQHRTKRDDCLRSTAWQQRESTEQRIRILGCDVRG